MIKTVLKHYFLDKFITSILNNLVTVFTPIKSYNFHVGEQFSSISIMDDSGLYGSIENELMYYIGRIVEVNELTLTISFVGACDILRYESPEDLQVAMRKYEQLSYGTVLGRSMFTQLRFNASGRITIDTDKISSIKY